MDVCEKCGAVVAEDDVCRVKSWGYLCPGCEAEEKEADHRHGRRTPPRGPVRMSDATSATTMAEEFGPRRRPSKGGR